MFNYKRLKDYYGEKSIFFLRNSLRISLRSLGLSFFFLFLSFTFTFAKNIDVGNHFPFHTLKDAIAFADSGDVIYVHGGIYKEGNIIIKKSITLCGIQQPVIDGGYKDEVITITANNVILDGFVIQHSGRSDLKEIAGIHLLHVHNVLIADNELLFNFFSLVLDESVSCIIINNKIMSNASTEASSGNGIHCWKSSNLTIESNTISGQRDGIYFEFVTNSYVKNNRSEKNLRYGIHFMFSNYDTYIRNTFRNNGSGVAVMYSHHVNMYHNTFEKNGGGAAYGLLLKELTDSKIIANQFSENTTGIFLEGTSRSRFERNQIHSNGWALKILGDCYSDTIVENNFSGNTFDVTTNSNENQNLFSKNYWDKYRGYDLNRDGIGDVPFRPVSLYSKLVETVPNSVLLLHSFFVNVLDQTEKILPSITPEQFRDDSPKMKPYDLAAH
ncbi:MAG TPA: nitrous oxide reductase family maturation protein NosD [Chitinophagales bacterium]|nr:nitrous oxide reductase family maturation protein NosD [Chitinophagales bacterium]